MRLFLHPFSSYCQKALIAFYENEIPFDYLMLSSQHPENGAEQRRLWPLGKFPVLEDEDAVVVEATSIIEHLAVHRPGSTCLIPNDPKTAVRVRMLDRIFDNYVMTPMMKLVIDVARPESDRDPAGVREAGALLDQSYAWLEGELSETGWLAGEYGLAECAASPSLFYADWVRPIPEAHPKLRAYRARLLARPSFARAVEEARPYRPLFPPGAPDRD